MILFIAFLIILAMLSTKISAKAGLPLLFGFILIGVLVGSDVLNLFYFDNAVLTKKIADILLIFIIFDGGFRITKEAFKTAAGPSLTLATLGVAHTRRFNSSYSQIRPRLFPFDFIYYIVNGRGGSFYDYKSQSDKVETCRNAQRGIGGERPDGNSFDGNFCAGCGKGV